MLVRRVEHSIAVQWFHRAHVDMGGVELLSHFGGGAIDAAKRQQRDAYAVAGALATHLGLANRQRL